LSAYQSGNNQWIIDGTAGNIGFTDLTFYYTDGLDTLSETITIEVVTPEIPSFSSAQLSFCINEGQINLNEYVDLTQAQEQETLTIVS
jgi:hypothetical protein